MGGNEKCLCGSGKKYKHCCAVKIPADMNKLMEMEFIQLKQEILKFATTRYGENINGCITEFFEEVMIEDDEEFHVAEFLLMIWVIFSLPIAENQQTILQAFVKKHGKKIKRPALKEAINDWQGAVPSIFKVLKDDHGILHVEDIFTEEEKQIHMWVGGEESTETLEGSYVLGTVINYRNRSYFFVTFYVIDNPSVIKAILSLYDDFSNEYSPEKFVDDLYPEIIELIFDAPMNLENIDWDTEQQREVIELVKANLSVPEEIQLPLQGLAITLWKLYCTKTGGNIRSVENYAAALHYTVGHFMTFFGEEEPAKAELASLYNVKMRALSTTINKLYDVLENNIDNLLDELTFGFGDEEFDYDFDDDDDDIDLKDLFLDDDDDDEPFDAEEFIRNFEEDLFKRTSDSKPIVDELAKKRAEKQKIKK